jgi:hypothetical protein
MPPRPFLAVLAVVGALGVASAAAANAGDVDAYRAKVNRLCRTYTPQVHRLAGDIAGAKKAQDAHRLAYDIGALLGLQLKEGAQLERMPLPAGADSQLRSALRLLHDVDAQARRTLSSAVAGDSAGFAREMAKLTTLARPLNHRFDIAGLADCGSRQS